MKRAIVALALIGSMMSAGVDDVRAESVDGCPTEIVETFGVHASTACRVAWCESKWDQYAVGSAGEVSRWQIHPIHFSKYSRQRLINDPWYAAEVAYEMSYGGRNWSAWSCA